MKNFVIALLLMMIAGCSDNTARKEVATPVDTVKTKPINPYIALIDKRAAEINTNIGDSFDFCEIMTKANALLTLSNDDESLQYAKKKVLAIQKVLDKFRDEYKDNQLNMYEHNYLTNDYELNEWKKKGGTEVVAIEAGPANRRQEGNRWLIERTYKVTVRTGGGLSGHKTSVLEYARQAMWDGKIPCTEQELDHNTPIMSFRSITK